MKIKFIFDIDQELHNTAMDLGILLKFIPVISIQTCFKMFGKLQNYCNYINYLLLKIA